MQRDNRPSPFLRATLKRWEWPGDEANVYTYGTRYAAQVRACGLGTTLCGMPRTILRACYLTQGCATDVYGSATLSLFLYYTLLMHKNKYCTVLTLAISSSILFLHA